MNGGYGWLGFEISLIVNVYFVEFSLRELFVVDLVCLGIDVVVIVLNLGICLFEKGGFEGWIVIYFKGVYDKVVVCISIIFGGFEFRVCRWVLGVVKGYVVDNFVFIFNCFYFFKIEGIEKVWVGEILDVVWIDVVVWKGLVFVNFFDYRLMVFNRLLLKEFCMF